MPYTKHLKKGRFCAFLVLSSNLFPSWHWTVALWCGSPVLVVTFSYCSSISVLLSGSLPPTAPGLNTRSLRCPHICSGLREYLKAGSRCDSFQMCVDVPVHKDMMTRALWRRSQSRAKADAFLRLIELQHGSDLCLFTLNKLMSAPFSPSKMF